MFKIEKGIPVPVKGRPAIYPFNEMEIGDSFLVLLGDRRQNTVRTTILGAAHRNDLRGRKLTTSYIKEEDGIRCWRIE